MDHRADLYILDKRKKSLGISGNPHADRLARSVVNISIMPFHVPFFVVLLYIMLFIELCGLYLKINVIFVLKLHAMKVHTRYETQWPDFYKSGHFWSKKVRLTVCRFQHRC